MLLGNIIKKSGTNNFVFLVKGNAKKFMYVQTKHLDGYEVLSQIVEIEKEGQETVAKCNVLGYRDKEGILKNLRTPLEPGSEITYAEDKFVSEILGLEKNEKGAYIGVLEDRENIKVYLDLNKLITKHVAVIAKSGAGKSFTVSTILEEILDKNIPVVVIDPHGEYNSLKYPSDKKEHLKRFGLEPKAYFKNVVEYSPDIQKNPEARPLKLSGKNLSGAELMHLLPAKLSSSQIGLLYSALSDVAREADFDQLMMSLQAEENNAKWVLINIIDYLKKLNIFSDVHTSVNELVNVGRCTIINLRGVPTEVQEVIVYKVVSDLFNARKQGMIPPFFLVIEEAHAFCLTEDTKILTSNGNKPISKLTNVDNIATINFNTGTFEYKPISKIHNSNLSEVYEIKTKFGNIIETTKDHPFFSREGYVCASGLDHIAIPIEFSYNMSNDSIKARLAGHILSDGWMETRGGVGFSGKYQDMLKIKKDLELLGYKSTKISERKSISKIDSLDYGIFIVKGKGCSFTTGIECFKLFKELGLPIGRKVLQPYLVPKFVLFGSNHVKAEFLAALMGGDGYKPRIKTKNIDVIRISFSKIIELKSNAGEFVSQIIGLFNSLGINATFWIRNGNLRKTDNKKTLKFIIDILNNSLNICKFLSLVGYRYCKEKEDLSRKIYYYYLDKIIESTKRDDLRKKILKIRSDTGYGKIKLAKMFNLSPNLVKWWIYDFKIAKKVDSPNVGRNFPNFYNWCKKYTDLMFIFDPILTKELKGFKKVYNISLPNNNFIANNCLVHNCPERSFGEVKSSSILRQVLAEGRKFGLGVAIVSQRPARLDKTVLSQCNTQIIMKVTNPNDLRSISSGVEGITSETEGEIINLHVGSALIAGIADTPLFIQVRPRKTRHGGEAVDIVGTFSGVKIENSASAINGIVTGNIDITTSDNKYSNESGKTKEVLSIVRPKVSKEDIRLLVNKKIKNLKSILVPCSFIICKDKNFEFNLLINLVNGNIITDIERGTGKPIDLPFDKLSEKESKLLGLVSGLKKEFTAADLFAKSGMMFSEVYDIINNLVKKGFFVKNGSNYNLSEEFNVFLNLKDYASYEKNEFIGMEYDEKMETKFNPNNFINLLKRFVNVINYKDCFIVKYDVEYER